MALEFTPVTKVNLETGATEEVKWKLGDTPSNQIASKLNEYHPDAKAGKVKFIDLQNPEDLSKLS